MSDRVCGECVHFHRLGWKFSIAGSVREGVGFCVGDEAKIGAPPITLEDDSCWRFLAAITPAHFAVCPTGSMTYQEFKASSVHAKARAKKYVSVTVTDDPPTVPDKGAGNG